MVETPVKIGILIDGDSIWEWQRRVLDAIASREDAIIAVVVQNDSSDSLIQSAIKKVLSDGLWGLVVGLRDTLVDPWFRQPVPLSNVECLDSVPKYGCEPLVVEQFGNELPMEAIEILTTECNLAVRFGFGVLRGDVLSAPEHGVLSFHHGDIREYRGRPAGFWEFYEERTESGVTLQRLTETLDGGEIVASATVDIGGCQSWTAVQDLLFATSVPVLQDGLDAIVVGESPMEPSQLGQIYKTPTVQEIGIVGLRMIRKRLY